MPGTVNWEHRVTGITPDGDSYAVIGEGWYERFDVVVGADGAWSRMRSLLSGAVPAYEGVTLVEWGFDVERHPAIDALTGSGKMFAVGDNRVLITQCNGLGHIRGYAGLCMTEAAARQWQSWSSEEVRAALEEAFAGWAPALQDVIETGEFIAIRPLHALPVGHRWESRRGLTLLGDAAHLMSPFSGEGVNLALADAVDLAGALTSGDGWAVVTRYEELMAARVSTAAEGAAQGLSGAFSPAGRAPVLEHYRARVNELD